MNIKLVALDMDGTLLNREKEIAPETQQAVARAVAAGYQVVIATGRNFLEFEPMLPQLEAVRYAVTCGGSSVMDCKSQAILASSAMPKEVAMELYGAIADDPMIFEVFCDGKIFDPKDRFENAAYYTQHTGNPIPANTRTTVEDMAIFLKELEKPIEKVHIYYYDNATRNAGWDKVRHLPLTIATSEDVDLDISPLNVDKGVGLSKLAAMLDVTADQILAVGDSFNDVGMFRYAGTTVAMGNAEPELKDMADYITETNVNHGVAKVLSALVDGTFFPQ